MTGVYRGRADHASSCEPRRAKRFWKRSRSGLPGELFQSGADASGLWSDYFQGRRHTTALSLYRHYLPLDSR